MATPANINSGNAHLVNTYTHHSVEKIAIGSLSVTAWWFLKLTWPFIDLAWPWDAIEWVSLSKKDYESDNSTVKQETVIYKQVKEYDTFLVKVKPWNTAILTMVGQTVDIDTDQYIDLWTVGSWTQFRIERIVQSGKEVEVILLDALASSAIPSPITSSWGLQWTWTSADPVALAYDTLNQNPAPPSSSLFSFYNPVTQDHETITFTDLEILLEQDLLIDMPDVATLRTLRSGSQLEPWAFYKIPYSRGQVQNAFVTLYASAPNKLSQSCSVETIHDTQSARSGTYDLTDDRLISLEDNRENRVYGKTQVDSFPRWSPRFIRCLVQTWATPIRWTTAGQNTWPSFTNVTFADQCNINFTWSSWSVTSSTFHTRSRWNFTNTPIYIIYANFGNDSYGDHDNVPYFRSYYSHYHSTMRYYQYGGQERRDYYSYFWSVSLIRQYDGTLYTYYAKISSYGEIRKYGTGRFNFRYGEIGSRGKYYERSNFNRTANYCRIGVNGYINNTATVAGRVDQCDVSRASLQISWTTDRVQYCHLNSFSTLTANWGRPIRVLLQGYAILRLNGFNATNVSLLWRITKTLTANNTNRGEVLNNWLI